ncbi:MAG: MBL fold metallo-hydrolase [Burkholderiales bacterium]|nr:MBL fold metallo-hydrolase [Burkholderiales bacterium]
MRRILSLALAALGAACAMPNPYYDPAKPHHTPEGFRNNYPHAGPQGYWKWQRERWREGRPHKPAEGYRFEVVAQRGEPPNPSVTWIGHATLLVRIGGLNLLTDPQFSERASPLAFAGPRRVVPPAIALEDLPHIDAVLVSHSHYDHLDAASVRALAAQPGGAPVFFAGLGLKPWFAALGIESVEELDWWETRRLRDAEIRFVPVQHWSARTPWDRNRTLWGGFVVAHPDLRFFFAGDTGYSRDFRDIAARAGPIDLAAIPIGGYAPRWFMQAMHVDADEAVQIHVDLAARRSIGIHWGTFDDLTDESLYEPPVRLRAALAARGLSPEVFWLLEHGESRSLERIARPARTGSHLVG